MSIAIAGRQYRSCGSLRLKHKTSLEASRSIHNQHPWSIAFIYSAQIIPTRQPAAGDWESFSIDKGTQRRGEFDHVQPHYWDDGISGPSEARIRSRIQSVSNRIRELGAHSQPTPDFIRCSRDDTPGGRRGPILYVSVFHCSNNIRRECLTALRQYSSWRDSGLWSMVRRLEFHLAFF